MRCSVHYGTRWMTGSQLAGHVKCIASLTVMVIIHILPARCRGSGGRGGRVCKQGWGGLPRGLACRLGLPIVCHWGHTVSLLLLLLLMLRHIVKGP